MGGGGLFGALRILQLDLIRERRGSVSQGPDTPLGNLSTIASNGMGMWAKRDDMSKARGGRSWVATALALGLGTGVIGCEADGEGRFSVPGLGDADVDEPTVLETQEGLDEPLSQAAEYLKDDSHWVTPDGGDGAGNGSGTCAGHCGGFGSDGDCACDAQCEDNGDCCSDYGQHCSSPNDDDPAPATCAGHCGGVGSDASCHCDALCEANDDCCSDYEQHCSGGEGEGESSGTCVGHCGGVGSDGQCYCDGLCTENDDCCSDYLASCGNQIEARPPSGMTTASRPAAASSSPCWAVITDPIEVQPIIDHAVGTGALLGGTCVAVVVAPAGAAAAPTAGASVGAAALACSGAALGGSIRGAVVSLLSQKMGSIAECSASVLDDIIREFPWGLGVKVVWFSTAERKHGKCTPDEHEFLQDEVDRLCKNSGKRSCQFSDECETLYGKVEATQACIDAREQVNESCFNGGNAGHRGAVDDERRGRDKCLSYVEVLECEDPGGAGM